MCVISLLFWVISSKLSFKLSDFLNAIRMPLACLLGESPAICVLIMRSLFYFSFLFYFEVVSLCFTCCFLVPPSVFFSLCPVFFLSIPFPHMSFSHFTPAILCAWSPCHCVCSFFFFFLSIMSLSVCSCSPLFFNPVMPSLVSPSVFPCYVSGFCSLCFHWLLKPFLLLLCLLSSWLLFGLPGLLVFVFHSALFK